MLVNITGGPDLTLAEVNEAMNVIHEAADPDANIIFGTLPDDEMSNSMKITVIATGFDVESRRPLSEQQPRALPAGYKSGASGTGNAATPANSNAADPLEDLDVPTFIRKRVD